MIANLIPQLATLIVTVRKNVLSSVMTTVMIIVIIVAWSARGNIATWIAQNPSASQQTVRLQRGRESDSNIEIILKNNMVSTNADRIGIRQYSDQVDSRSSVTIPYVTTTHVVVAPGVSQPTPQISSMPRSYISDVTDRMYAQPTPKCARLATSEIKDEIYHRLLVEVGVFETYVCPISDLNGSPVGFIYASYLTPTKPRPTEAELFAILTNTSTRVAGYLAEVTAPEKEGLIARLLAL